jgi:hypothetical protein
MEGKEKSLPIFNPAVPTIVMTVIAAAIGVFMANFTGIFAALM